MITKEEIGDVLVVFKSAPNEDDMFTDEPVQFLWLAGEKIDPIDGMTYICYDICGYDWEVPASKIGCDREYDWIKRCTSRILAGMVAKRKRH